jgi:hypothetical protein
MYFRNYTRMRTWDKVKLWVEKGFLKPPKFYETFKMFDTSNHTLDFKFGKHQGKDKSEVNLLEKFFRKYPDADVSPIVSGMLAENPNPSYRTASERFIARQKKYMRDGFNEDKAFQMVEQEMSEDLQKEKFERSLFEGLATSNRSRSLMSYYEQEAEFEARQKLKQIQNTIPQYKRHQVDLEKIYENLVKNEESNKVLDTEAKAMDNYQPATCKLFCNSKILLVTCMIGIILHKKYSRAFSIEY